MLDICIQRTVNQFKAALKGARSPSEAVQRIQTITAELTPEDRQELWGWIREKDPLLAAKLKAIRVLGKPLGLREILAIDFPKARITLACQWYEDNRRRIQAQLPLEIRDSSGRISFYQANWDISYWIQKWRAGTLPILEADRFIPSQLGPLVAVFDDADVMGRAA